MDSDTDSNTDSNVVNAIKQFLHLKGSIDCAYITKYINDDNYELIYLICYAHYLAIKYDTNNNIYADTDKLLNCAMHFASDIKTGTIHIDRLKHLFVYYDASVSNRFDIKSTGDIYVDLFYFRHAIGVHNRFKTYTEYIMKILNVYSECIMQNINILFEISPRIIHDFIYWEIQRSLNNVLSIMYNFGENFSYEDAKYILRECMNYIKDVTDLNKILDISTKLSSNPNNQILIDEYRRSMLGANPLKIILESIINGENRIKIIDYDAYYDMDTNKELYIDYLIYIGSDSDDVDDFNIDKIINDIISHYHYDVSHAENFIKLFNHYSYDRIIKIYPDPVILITDLAAKWLVDNILADAIEPSNNVLFYLIINSQNTNITHELINYIVNKNIIIDNITDDFFIDYVAHNSFENTNLHIPYVTHFYTVMTTEQINAFMTNFEITLNCPNHFIWPINFAKQIIFALKLFSVENVKKLMNILDNNNYKYDFNDISVDVLYEEDGTVYSHEPILSYVFLRELEMSTNSKFQYMEEFREAIIKFNGYHENKYDNEIHLLN